MTVKTAVVDYRPEHRTGLLALWRQFFGSWSAEQLLARWRWQFDDNPFARDRQPLVLIATHGDEVVGHISGFPLPLRLDDVRRIALCGSSLVVADAHRLIALKLVNALVKQKYVIGSGLRPEAMKLFRHFGTHVVPSSSRRFTFPLGRGGELARRVRARLPERFVSLARTEAFQRVGRLSALARWAAPDRPAPRSVPTRPTTADIRPLVHFGKDYDALWDIARTRFRCAIGKNAEYMNWRYLQCPTLHPWVYGLFRGDRLDGVLVAFRRTELDWTLSPCVVHGEIAELIVRPDAGDDAVELLLVGLRALAVAGVDEVTATGMHPDLVDAFASVGFVREQGDEYALGVLVPPEDRERLHAGIDAAWYTSAADGDALYAPSL
jgi:hypothetical protein